MPEGAIIFRYIFPCLNPKYFSMYANQLFKLYDFSLVLTTIVVIILLVYYYFFTLPNPSSIKRFWIIFLSNLLLGSCMPVMTIGTRYSYLLTNSNPDVGKAIFILYSLIAGLGTVLFLLIIFYAIIMLASLINIPWRLKAMKRYPFNLKFN